MKISEYMKASAKQLAEESARLRGLMKDEVKASNWTTKAGKLSRRAQMVEAIGNYLFFDSKEFDDEMRKVRNKADVSDKDELKKILRKDTKQKLAIRKKASTIKPEKIKVR